MSLQEQLDAYKAGFKERVPADKQAVMLRATEDLRQSGLVETAIRTGMALPAFSLPNQKGETVSSQDLLDRGPLVITVFRGVWCPYCNIEIAALNAIAAEVRQAGGEIVAISPQHQASAQATVEKNSLDFDVLVDEGNAYTRQLGLVFALPDDLREIYTGFGLVLPEHNGDDSWTLPMPARLVVRTDGQIAYADVNPDYTVRPEPSETLAVLRDITATAAV